MIPIRMSRIDIIPPRICRSGTGPAGVFPLSLARKDIRVQTHAGRLAASRCVEACEKNLYIVPRNLFHRTVRVTSKLARGGA